MSTFEPRPLTCPRCGVTTEREVAISLSGDRSAEVREAIVAGTFQVFACPGCGEESTADGPLMFMDLERRHWVACYPRAWESAWRGLESEPLDTWRRTIVDHAPVGVRKMAGGFVIRAVFGLPMLREKLLCWDHGVDDRLLEALKFDLMRSGELPMHPLARPILDQVSEDALHLGASVEQEHAGELDGIDAAMGLAEYRPWRPVSFRVPRARLAHIAEHRHEWAALIRQLSAGPYVDTGRLLVPGTEAPPS